MIFVMKKPTRMKRVFDEMKRMGNGKICKEERLIRMDLNPERRDDISMAAMIHNAQIVDEKDEDR